MNPWKWVSIKMAGVPLDVCLESTSAGWIGNDICIGCCDQVINVLLSTTMQQHIYQIAMTSMPLSCSALSEVELSTPCYPEVAFEEGGVA